MKIFLFGLFVSLFLFALPQPAEALYREVQGTNNFKDYSFAIFANNDEPNPPEFVKDTGDILIGVTAWKDSAQQNIFTQGDRFHVLFENKSTNYKCNRSTNLAYPSTAQSGPNPSAEKVQISVTAKFPPCLLTPGTYQMTFFSDADKSPWFVVGDFPVNSPSGGSTAKLVALNEPNLVCANKVTEVQIENAEIGKDFNLYWKGDLWRWAWQGKASERNFTVQLSAGPESGFNKQFERNELCLIEGKVNVPPGGQFFTCPNPLKFEPTTDESKCSTATSASCEAKVQLMENSTAKKQAVITGKNFPGGAFAIKFTSFRGDLVDTKNSSAEPKRFPDITASANGTVSVNTGELPAGTYMFNFYPQLGSVDLDSQLVCSIPNFVIDDKVETGNAANPDQIDFKSVVCDPKSTGAENRCADSSGEYCDAEKKLLRTAIGCVPVDPGLFVAGMMKYITGFAGGAALLMMIFGAFQMMTSGGNAEGLKKGREQFVSAVIGLLFVIFSVLLMQIIGVDLLGLPGFKK